MTIDVARACANADCTRAMYVQLPTMPDPEGQRRARLKKAMNGTRDGANHWGEHFAHVLSQGFKQF